MTRAYVLHDLYAWRDSFILIYWCDMTHSYMTWLTSPATATDASQHQGKGVGERGGGADTHIASTTETHRDTCLDRMPQSPANWASWANVAVSSCVWVMSHVCMSMSHVARMSHVPRSPANCATCANIAAISSCVIWVMAHVCMCMSHVARMNESCVTIFRESVWQIYSKCIVASYEYFLLRYLHM